MEAVRGGAAVGLENAQIVGRLDLHNMQVRGDVRIVSSEIMEFADFSYAVFERTLRLDRCTLHQGACFDSTRFRSDVWLDGSTFGAHRDPSLERATILFNDAEFIGVLSARSVRFADGTTASFERARFGSLVYLEAAQFEGSVNFSSIRVNGDLYLDQARFFRPCNLAAAKVAGAVTLSEAHFSRRAHVSLSEAEVGRGIMLSNAIFLGAFTADRARFGRIDGPHAVFAYGLGLNDATVGGSVNLPQGRFGRRFVTDLRGLSVGGQLDLTDALFKGTLRVDDATVCRTLLGARSRFRGWAAFDRLHAGAVNLVGARFESRSTRDAPTFSHVVVSGVFTAKGACFRKGVDVSSARTGELIFDNARCYGPVNCALTAVIGNLSFSAARIRAKEVALNLEGVDVGEIAWFDDSRFAGKVSGIGLHVEKQFSWNRVVTLGDADFYELDVRRGAFLQSAKFGGALKLDRSRLTADVYLCGAVCRGAATFDKSTIGALLLGRSDPPHDRAVKFNGGVSLQHCLLGYLGFQAVTVSDLPRKGRARKAEPSAGEQLKAVAAFDHCEVSGVANFSGAIFRVPATFYGATFIGEALFQQVEFRDRGATSFSTCTFRGRAVFYRARFDAEADFNYARFENAALFRARFGKNASFDMSRFLGVAEFSEPDTICWTSDDDLWSDPDKIPPGSWFASASFVQARFAGDARFDSAQFASSLDLREAMFATLYLPSNSDPQTESKLLPRWIGLVGCHYEQISLKHPLNLLLHDRKALRLVEGYDRQPFAQLEETLRRAGDDQAADDVYLAGRRAEGQQKLPIAGLLDWIYGVLVNYGVRPWRLAGLALVLTLAGAWFFSHPGTVELKDKTQRGQSPYPVTWGEALNLGVAEFLPVSLPIKEQLIPSSEPVSIALPIPGVKPRLMMRLRPSSTATILQLAGWILVPIGVAAMTGVLMRKSK